MELLSVMEGRRSIRKYKKDRPVGDQEIGELLEAFRWAPSEGNLQPWLVIIVKDDGIINELSRAAYDQGWVSTAPVVFVICIDLKKTMNSFGERGMNLYSIQSTAAAIQNMLLMAHYKGLGACWVSAFEEDKAYRILDLPEWVRPVALITVGYPAENPKVPLRLDVTDFTFEDKFGTESRVRWKGIGSIINVAKRDGFEGI